MTQSLGSAAEQLYNLLPALYRIYDSVEGKQIDPTADTGPIKELLTIIAREYRVIEENIDQLYDDMFIETCAEWVVPYIGDLLGVRGLYSVSPQTNSHRAYVANTVAYRRRKGTAAMLEQLAHDVTGWNSNAVEYFERLAATQYLNHLRLDRSRTLDLRYWEPLERLDTPFDASARTINVRRIVSRGGKHNIPNIGIFLWRLDARRLMESPAVPVGSDGRRWMFSPLGENRQLFTFPQTEDTISHLAEPINVPAPISRHVLNQYLEDYYGVSLSLCIFVNGKAVLPTNVDPLLHHFVQVCDLSDKDDGSGDWGAMPIGDAIAVDPVLGRIAFSTADTEREVAVTYHYAFSMEMGGGQYTRQREKTDSAIPVIKLTGDLQTELNNVSGSSEVIEIPDSGRYTGALTITATTAVPDGEPKQYVELRAADGKRPTIDLGGGELLIELDHGTQVTLDGLLITNGLVRVHGNVGTVKISHCTLVPGWSLHRDGTPAKPDQPSLVVEIATIDEQNGINIVIDHSITGALRLPTNETTLLARSSIIDSPSIPAIAAADSKTPAGDATFECVTVLGTVAVRELILASNSIFTEIVTTERLQSGCVRYSYVAPGSTTPRRYECQPQNDERPIFTSTRYGDPAYGQLSRQTSLLIRAGASDDAEMGVFHDLYQPQRETNLRVRLDEYLRLGLEVGIFYTT
ncbi:MAG: hypothetical protein GC204_16415 [Chloroflexi bacterium]|nr:hypothetical protein [Chloroflexota bacterium]